LARGAREVLLSNSRDALIVFNCDSFVSPTKSLLFLSIGNIDSGGYNAHMTRRLDSAKNSRGINAKSITYFFHSLFNDVPNLFKFPCPLILVRLFYNREFVHTCRNCVGEHTTIWELQWTKNYLK